jgi:2-oxoglutarate dehydrogenase E2 component (dihydrolipoamide succinyltransferase)
MPIPLKVPSLGESIQQATVGAWLKREGEAVRVDEAIVEIESEKATVALPAPAAGVLRRVLKNTGDTVAIGEVIAEMEEGAIVEGPLTPALSPAGAGEREESVRAGEREESVRAGEREQSARAGEREQWGGAKGGVARAPPSARRLMAEHGVRAEAVEPTGPGGRVRKEDVLRALEAPRRELAEAGPPVEARAPGPAPAPRDGAGARERVIAMTPLRRTVARRLVEAQQTAAILTTFNEVDMSRVLALRGKHGEAFLAKHGVKLGFMSFFVKAAIDALRAYPAVNAEVRGTDVVYKDHYDVGVAVGGGKGLVVPVVRNADALSFAEIEKTIGDLAKKARENRITMDDLEGGTFTISNGGIYGSLLSTPILNPPQSGILGLHKIEKRAVVGPGDEIVVRPMMYLALSYDHRIVDGREAVSFLVRVKEAIEDPERMLLEV